MAATTEATYYLWPVISTQTRRAHSTAHHCYISHNHPYIHKVALSDTLGGTISISTATYVGMHAWLCEM